MADPFALLAQSANTRRAELLLATATAPGTDNTVTVALLGATVTAARIAGPAPQPGETVLLARQGALLVALGVLKGAQ